MVRFMTPTSPLGFTMVSRLTNRGYRCKVFTGIAIIAFITYFKYFHFTNTQEIYIPNFHKLNLESYPDLGILKAEKFPLSGEARIPKIIHQTWIDTDVPYHYVEWVKSWVKNHPDWTYMFWTDASARQLIADKHSKLLAVYDGYLENIRRADAMRYVILYEYGGVYADLDMENLLPMDDIVRKYTCVLPQEPYEHPIIDGNFEHLAINALMACRAKHPLMKSFMDNLPNYYHFWNVLDSTGPHYITRLYRRYVEETNIDPSHDDGVYLAPAEYFFPEMDPLKFGYMREKCLKFAKLSYIQQKACVSLKVRGLERKPYSFSFTTHHWIHTYLSSKISLHGPVNVFSIVPACKIYKTGDLIEN